MFYDKFIKEVLQFKYKNPNENIKSGHFRNWVIEKYGKTVDVILLFSNSLKTTINKPQRLLENGDDYYIACDLYTSTIYMSFKHLIMLDIDYENYNYKQFENRLVDVYKTRKGYHIFFLDQEYEYTNNKTLQFMLDCKADFYNIIYTYIRGSCVRLNCKLNEKSPIYTYIGRFGNSTAIPRLEYLVQYHIQKCNEFKNFRKSLMK